MREASFETMEPDGQPDSIPTIGLEPTQAERKKEKSKKEVLLVTAEKHRKYEF